MTRWIEMPRCGEGGRKGGDRLGKSRGAEGEGTLSFKLTQCSMAGQ